MEMSEENKDLLFSIVRTNVAIYGKGEVLFAIRQANNGRPDDRIVTLANQHLFRQWRNSMGCPVSLVDAAMEED